MNVDAWAVFGGHKRVNVRAWCLLTKTSMNVLYPLNNSSVTVKSVPEPRHDCKWTVDKTAGVLYKLKGTPLGNHTSTPLSLVQ